MALLDCHGIDALVADGIRRPADDGHRYTCLEFYASPVVLVSKADTVLCHEREQAPMEVGILARMAPQSFLYQ